MSPSNLQFERVKIPQPEEVAPAIADSEPAAAPRLLIVDDIADNRAILLRRFQRHGFEVVEADSGQKALELIDSQEFDLVLLDVMMPGIDGIETLKRIRSQKSASALPVIMVTAKSESENIVESLGLGANDYITKPVDFAVALARAHTQIGLRRAELQLVAAHEALSRANDDLEKNVAERTEILLGLYQKLRVETAVREEADARSLYLAYHDTLTGLANRLLFKEQLENILKYTQETPMPVAVLLVDLDGFKAINDTLGHSIGDLLLKSIAIRIRDILPVNGRVARLGGDEFAILQVSAEQPAAAITLAQQILDVVGQPLAVEGHDVTVSASIGIAVANVGSMSAENFLKSADIAMYNAKSQGRGNYRMFDAEMDAIVQARSALERDMRNGILQNDFRLFYQPLVNLKTKKVTAFEALMRWQHPERGTIPPLEFIPLAEETGLIVRLGEWALREACSEAMDWPEDISVSVNLSVVQFIKGDLVSTVINALASSGLPASRLELEITESVLLEQTGHNTRILDQLHELGVRISLDDFGTGYSSIGYLRSFKFDKIKIDQSFVKDLLGDKKNLAIVRAIVGLGTSFGITTTAEGVETEDQRSCLDREGCTEVQGYLYSRPLPANEIGSLIEKHGAARLARAASLDRENR
ncbi:MAG: EAL domain-containing protein [Bradyrhizobium sp.]|uniref:putative bifunctional diguanylate cyclase/phosphodiesterase n=1 Tax=Bradyrhizobium sp. TaxID=376 RepID=UPI00273182A4|nr:EAL domain-containing protein [Bradyrhizobium sp.]MDP1868776.1 EAL domain-containing protein [Bradyrhizobium sp.]